ncbi:hypothetical protein M8J75_005815 [Diaphorina citri]|nr:hypothetical protein M8J75_005815 [Diaphorina citri]
MEMDFTLDFYFRQFWTDPRLAFRQRPGVETLSVGSDFIKNIWVPDTFFVNEKQSYFHIATTSNEFIRIHHSGSITRSIRLTITASCPMNLQYFPMDRQLCHIEIESFGYTMRDIRYKWNEGPNSVGVSNEVSLPQFKVLGHRQKDLEISLTTGNYSRLACEIQFVRSMGYYLIQIYIPSSLIVAISWVSFWLNRNATPARVALGVTTVLTMTTLMSSTNAALPKVSYVKSIDVYLGTCFVMVFASLLGNYSRLACEIQFVRSMGYYLIQIYVPSILIVAISWVSFWLNRVATVARVNLGVTTVLTMTTLMSSTNAALPKVSYIKSIDVYLGTCFVMVFACLLGNYSRLACEIQFVRSMGYYLIQIYIPSGLIVIISWVSFWLNRNATPARVALGVTTVLTMTTLMSSTNAALPKISYVKSIDVYLGTCFVMVFASLLEYATVGYMAKRIQMRKNRFMALQKVAEQKKTIEATGHPGQLGLGHGPPGHGTLSHSSHGGHAGHGHSHHSHHGGHYAPHGHHGPLVDDHMPKQTVRFKVYDPKAHSKGGTLENTINGRSTDEEANAPPGPGGGAHLIHPGKDINKLYGITPSDIDKYSRIVFPVCFVCFNLMYWIIYLHISDVVADDLVLLEEDK